MPGQFGARVSAHVRHIEPASLAQIESQAVSQQNGSMAQTAASHAESSQPTLAWAMQQLLTPLPAHTSQSELASHAQIESHAIVQQNESMPQTSASQSSSSHPMPPLAVQQSLSRAKLAPA